MDTSDSSLTSTSSDELNSTMNAPTMNDLVHHFNDDSFAQHNDENDSFDLHNNDEEDLVEEPPPRRRNAVLVTEPMVQRRTVRLGAGEVSVNVRTNMSGPARFSGSRESISSLRQALGK